MSRETFRSKLVYGVFRLFYRRLVSSLYFKTKEGICMYMYECICMYVNVILMFVDFK